MDERMVSYFAETLNRRLNEILPGMRHGMSSMVNARHHRDPMDEVDMTVERYEQELLLNMQCRAEKLVQEIRDALRRIRDGSFGICQECGRDIEIQRLKVQPMATLCLECKKEMESIQRRKVA